MKSSATLAGVSLLALLAGCHSSVEEPPRLPERAPYSVQRPAVPSDAPAAVAPEVSWDTDRDRTYARFLQGHSGGLIRKAAVGLEKRGSLKVEISRAVAPEDTLDLTKSLMAGARKDFPDGPILLSLYDPEGAPILKAQYRPGHGVRYQLAPGGSSASDGSSSRPSPGDSSSGAASDPLARSGVTASGRKFAAWAEEHGRAYLRYVQADLERNGRLWFGVTRDVKPADVPQLTESLLEGARKEFPKRELIATVFDPDGERIGRAHYKSDGKLRWER